MTTFAILLAAGSSSRAGANKLEAQLAGQTVLERSEEALRNHPLIDKVIVVGRDVPGGDSWMQSFQAGLRATQAKLSDLVLVHNAANPFVTQQEITDVIEAAQHHGAAAVSKPAVDTLMLTKNGFYDGHVDRNIVRHMQTPQAARYELLQDLPEATDLISALPIPAAVVDASPQNSKITHPNDLPTATFIGEDSHRFSKTGQLTLGGITVNSCPAMQANSDGDVILHALGRALAQATNMNFAEQADQLCEQGQNQSAAYLAPMLSALGARKIQNISIMLECARPKIDPLKFKFKNSIAATLNIQPEQISLSAMTGEDLTSFGRGEGIRALVCLTLTA